MATIYAKNKNTGEWEKVGPAANATDSTLSLAGSPADAKATGEAIDSIQIRADSAYSLAETKVDKVTGKGLSTNDYTTTEKNKLAGIAAGAEVNVNADWNATSGDAQILNKPTLGSLASKNTVAKTDLASAVQTSLGKADTALQSYTETDPTVPAWAKAASKPTYTASEVGALPNTTVIPNKTSQLTNDSGFITSSPVSSVNGKTGAVQLVASDVGALPISGGDLTGSLTVMDNFNVNTTYDSTEYKTYVRPINYSIGNNGDYSTGLIHYKGNTNQAQLMFSKDGVMLRDNVNSKAYQLFGQHNGETAATSIRSYLYTYGTTDMTAGTSELATGKIYLVYE